MNVEFTSLNITGYGDQPVPNQFVRQRGETSTLAVLLPGLGYTADMPLFYYAEWIALERGWDVLRVDYNYRSSGQDMAAAERGERLTADVDAAFDVGLPQRQYDRIVLMGKSLGSRAMDHLLGRDIGEEVWNVWLTPLINQPEIKRRIEAHSGRTFVAIGTEDFAYDADYLGKLSTDDVETGVIEGADHSMDISGDIVSSIRAMGEVMSRLDAFLPPA